MGDFNSVESVTLDRASGVGETSNVTAALGGRLDVWRAMHPNSKQWTFARITNNGEDLRTEASSLDSLRCLPGVAELMNSVEISEVSWQWHNHAPVQLHGGM